MSSSVHHRTIIIACSATKNAPRYSGTDAAAQLYNGVVWQVWRKHGPSDGALPSHTSLMVLSAEHGLIPGHQFIAPYDRRLNGTRVTELAPTVQEQWAAHVAGIGLQNKRRGDTEHSCCIIGGELYQDLATAGGLPVARRIDGRATDGSRGGIGLLRQRVKAFAGHVLASLRTPTQMTSWGEPDPLNVAPARLEPCGGDVAGPQLEAGRTYRKSANTRVTILRAGGEAPSWHYTCVDHPSGQAYDKNEFALLRLLVADGRVWPVPPTAADRKQSEAYSLELAGRELRRSMIALARGPAGQAYRDTHPESETVTEPSQPKPEGQMALNLRGH